MVSQQYTVKIHSRHWLECQLYLNQNYIKQYSDYTHTTANGVVTIVFTSLTVYSQFTARWARILQ